MLPGRRLPAITPMNNFAFDVDDAKVLDESYLRLRNKDSIEIVTDPTQLQELLKQLQKVLTLASSASLSFQNLFKVSLRNKAFCLAQCLLDFGYPFSGRQGQATERKYQFQAIGFATLQIDLGETILRPETTTDKIISRLIGNDIDFEGTERFNEKYYLASNKKDIVYRTFSREFIEAIGKHLNLVMRIEGKQMFLAFESELEVNQLSALEEIFCKCPFVSS